MSEKVGAARLEQIKNGAGPSMQECAAMVAEIQAARAYLATLTRYKEVEFSSWRVIDHTGVDRGYECSQSEAEEIASGHEGWQALRLTGTAKVKVTP